MALGARALLGVDWALATTGVAGPDRQEDQPVGTVHLGIAGPTGSRSVQLALEGDRAAVRRAACAGALYLLFTELGDG
jgi:nicotinamide-nucleotide amidase